MLVKVRELMRMRTYPATLMKVTLLHGCFSRFLNCINDTKSTNLLQIYLLIRVKVEIIPSQKIAC